MSSIGLFSSIFAFQWFPIILNSFNKELYIEDGNKYEELIYKRPKFKWYHILSKYINKKCKGEILEYRDVIPTVTYK